MRLKKLEIYGFKSFARYLIFLWVCPLILIFHVVSY